MFDITITTDTETVVVTPTANQKIGIAFARDAYNLDNSTSLTSPQYLEHVLNGAMDSYYNQSQDTGGGL